MDKDKVGTMMQSAKKVPISELNNCITCKLCKGYFIDATTIIECLHTFCRSCIVLYLESNKYCPICDVQVHKTKPLLNIRYDKTIQDLVYKLVPRLYCNEIHRQKLYYEGHPEEKPSTMEQHLASQYEYILAPEESINLTLKYHGCNEGIRYLRCPSAVSISHLKKLLRVKYELTEHHKIEIFYDQDCLSSSLSLMDVAYIYSWKRKSPLDFTYKIYECPAKKPKLEQTETGNIIAHNNIQHNNNNNNWKEVQLRISENGEMSITGIQDALVLDIPEKEIIIKESKISEDNQKEIEESEKAEESMKQPEVTPAVEPEVAPKKELPGLKFIGKSSEGLLITTAAPTVTVVSQKTTEVSICKNSTNVIIPKNAECSVSKNTTMNTVPILNLTNSELSVIPLSTTKACTTTTVFSTINKSMCSTKPAEKPALTTESKVAKRKIDLEDKGPPPKLPKPTILNHSIGLMNLSNNHPLKRHKLNRNGETVDKAMPTTSLINNVSISSTIPSKPIVINKSVSGAGLQKCGEQKAMTTPCYAPKQTMEKNAEKNDVRQMKTEINSTQKINTSHHSHSLHIPIITPAQLPHNQIVNAHHIKPPSTTSTTNSTTPTTSNQETTVTPTSDLSLNLPIIKTKPSTPIGYKTLRDPPKSWNSQINLQIAKNSNAHSNRQNVGDLKNVRPAKFFKGRNNMPRYLGNPASGVKPMYQLHVSPEKDKNNTENAKVEKREIKKHSIVKIDPKTLKPISEKAPETSNLSNVSMASGLQVNQELRLNSSPGDLKINTSSVSIFNPLKLQSSPKGDRKSPKSPHSPKVKATSCASGSAINPSLSPKQHRDKTNLTFTPPNPFVPNLASPTLGPTQWGFPSYDPRVVAAAYHNLWYNQRMVAAAAAGLVPSPMSHAFGLNMAMKSHVGGVPSKHTGSTKGDSKKTLETALEKLTQSKVKEFGATAKTTVANKCEVKLLDNKEKVTQRPPVVLNPNMEQKEAEVRNCSRINSNEVPPQSVSNVNIHDSSKENKNIQDTKVSNTKYDNNSNKPSESDSRHTVNGEQAVTQNNREYTNTTSSHDKSSVEINNVKAKRDTTPPNDTVKCDGDKDMNKIDKCDNSMKGKSDGDGNEIKGGIAEVREKGGDEQSVGA